MRFLKRHLISLIFGALALASLLGWWRSSKDWSICILEFPVGTLEIGWESSLFIFSLKGADHDQKYRFWLNADPISGDSMKFIWKTPEIRSNYNRNSLLVPCWQLLLLFTVLTCGGWALEKRWLSRMEGES